MFWNILEGLGITVGVILGLGALAAVAVVVLFAIASANGQNPFR